ncbi:MAG: chromophore lyase CpcT/CpeT [Phycisphaerales bacterium]
MTQFQRLTGTLFTGSMVFLIGCTSGGSGAGTVPSSVADPMLTDLVDRMTGSFSSAAQAERDDEYFDIRLEMVEIWPGRDDDASWLYVEQATAASLERPYRQRVYRVSRSDGNEFVSAVYELPGDPLAFAGWHEAPGRFDEALEPEFLTERTGCAVYLSFDAEGDAFVGSTRDGTCASSLRGADYVVSEVTVHPDRLLTWDRGFNSAGEQVWGATSGGYEFVRVD